MHADTLNLRELFEAPRRYIVPLFQRPYVWKKKKELEPLWLDLERVSDQRLAARGGTGFVVRGDEDHEVEAGIDG